MKLYTHKKHENKKVKSTSSCQYSSLHFKHTIAFDYLFHDMSVNHNNNMFSLAGLVSSNYILKQKVRMFNNVEIKKFRELIRLHHTSICDCKHFTITYDYSDNIRHTVSCMNTDLLMFNLMLDDNFFNNFDVYEGSSNV